jgi:hypothetical protein
MLCYNGLIAFGANTISEKPTKYKNEDDEAMNNRQEAEITKSKQTQGSNNKTSFFPEMMRKISSFNSTSPLYNNSNTKTDSGMAKLIENNRQHVLQQKVVQRNITCSIMLERPGKAEPKTIVKKLPIRLLITGGSSMDELETLIEDALELNSGIDEVIGADGSMIINPASIADGELLKIIAA